jgi:MFS transporter, UMF1 family
MSEENKIMKNNPREIFGWMTFDWANHAFFTLVLGVLIGEYLTRLAQHSVGENGAVITIGGYVVATAKSFFNYSIGISVFLQVFFLPVMGAIADYTHLKKTFMAFFTYLGALGCVLMFFVQGDLYLLGSIFFIVSNLSAGASIVFFNSYLTDITTEDRRDKVSSWSFATGYAGGALTLILSFIFLKYSESFGISTELAIRICLLGAGVWWGGFSLITFFLLKRRAPIRSAPEGKNFIAAGFGELKQTFRELFKLKHTLHFLIAYLLYNDGIQTVITSSAIFISQELFVAKGLEVDSSVLIISFLIAQIVGVIGSLVFERIAHWTSAKTAIIVSLVIWSGIVIYAFAFLQTLTEAYFMSGAIGFVLGGSQALSRSLFSQMIPAGRESAFFGIYAISERGTSWLGPIIFGLVAQLTNSYRPAILALIVFFVVGMIILFFTNTAEAIHDAGNLTPEEAASGK